MNTCQFCYTSLPDEVLPVKLCFLCFATPATRAVVNIDEGISEFCVPSRVLVCFLMNIT